VVEWREQTEVEDDIDEKIDGDVGKKIALAVTEAKAKVEGIGVKAAFDPTAMIAIITAIFDAIQNCRGSAGARIATAREHPRGFAAFVMRRQLIKRFREDNATRKDARNWARATVDAMGEAAPDDLADVLEQAEGQG